MTWTLSLAAVALASSLTQSPPLAEGTSAANPPVPARVAQPDVQRDSWMLSLRALGPATTTDPRHVGVAVGLSHSGAYRAAVQFQPTDSGRLGFIQASLGMRVMEREGWQLAIDLEHAQARPVRQGFRGTGWELDFHERHQLSVGTAELSWSDRRFFGLVTGIEVGGGRMQVWRLVSASAADAGRLSVSPDLILESAAPVGLLGVRMERPLFWGIGAETHIRVIGAGRSRGGEVPFAHATVDWDLTRQLFHSRKFGRAFLGLTGTHATSPRAVTYFQNGVGAAFRIAF